MGSIYVCRRVGAGGFQRLFTLKVIRQHSSQKEMAIKSFTREARIGALLNHPNVQTLVDVGSYEEQPFLILDYVEGTSLSELMGDDRRPPTPVVVSILLDVLRGLQHVHDVVDGQGARLGLVHGDVSPQNILVGVDGVARLTDFGSARFAKDDQAVDGHVAVGKPAYMAPEQLRGEHTDTRTDLFSVGILMWTALTGQKLFAAETYDQTVMRVMRRKIPPPSEFGAPPCLDPIILKALSRAPEGRYGSADEMSRDILKAAVAENLVATPRDVEQWVRRELGDTLADRRRKIQEMFGGDGRVPDGPDRSRSPRRGTPRTADGFERLPARTVQIGAAGLGWTAPSRPVKRVKHAPRSQWVVVIGSAVVAACALAVAVAYFVSSMMTPQKRPTKKMSVPASEISAAGAAAGAPSPPAEPALKSPEPSELRSETPPGR
jgi:serine/threonine-protein kinase